MASTQVCLGGEKEPEAGRDAGLEPGLDRDCVLLHRLVADGDRQPSSPRWRDCSCFVTCASFSAAERQNAAGMRGTWGKARKLVVALALAHTVAHVTVSAHSNPPAVKTGSG